MDKNITKLKRFARKAGCADNPLFQTALDQYIVQQRVISMIREAIDTEDKLTSEKTYVKGEKNVYANPLVKELPKHSDSANKTARLLWDIIKDSSVEVTKEDSLQDFLSEYDEV